MDSGILDRAKALGRESSLTPPKPQEIAETVGKSLAMLVPSQRTETPEAAAARVERRNSVRASAFEAFVARSGIPERHEDRRRPERAVRSGNEPWRPETVLHRICEGRFEGETIGLIGGRGVGKTQLGVWAIKHCCWEMASDSERRKAEETPRYTTAAAMFRRIRQGMKDGDEGAVFAKFTAPELLVVDALQNRGETDYEHRTLTEILDERYSSQRDTILISNLNEAEFNESVGPDIKSRMTENGILILCDWKPFRPEVRKERTLRFSEATPCVSRNSTSASSA